MAQKKRKLTMSDNPTTSSRKKERVEPLGSGSFGKVLCLADSPDIALKVHTGKKQSGEYDIHTLIYEILGDKVPKPLAYLTSEQLQKEYPQLYQRRQTSKCYGAIKMERIYGETWYDVFNKADDNILDHKLEMSIAHHLRQTMLKQIAESLVALHDKKIVLGDLCPLNLLMRYPRKDKKEPSCKSTALPIVFVDFGSAILDREVEYTPAQIVPPDPIVAPAWDWYCYGALVEFSTCRDARDFYQTNTSNSSSDLDYHRSRWDSDDYETFKDYLFVSALTVKDPTKRLKGTDVLTCFYFSDKKGETILQLLKTKWNSHDVVKRNACYIFHLENQLWKHWTQHDGKLNFASMRFQDPETPEEWQIFGMLAHAMLTNTNFSLI